MTMLLAQHGFTGNGAGSLIPTDDTKTYSLQSTFDENRYYLSSMIHQNPKDKRIGINTFDDGIHHVEDVNKVIARRNSTDLCLTWGPKFTFYDPSNPLLQTQGSSIGMDRKGSLHAMVDCHTDVGTAGVGGTHIINYIRSDDNGVTHTAEVNIPFPVGMTLLAVRMYGRLIDTGGGVLLSYAYFFTDEALFTNSERWLLRSTDYGATWTWIHIDSSTDYINEGEFLAVTQNIIFLVCRHEGNKQYYTYKSLDAGLTWIIVGPLGTTITMTEIGPPRLHKFRDDNGKWYCVLYFANKPLFRLYAIYGKLENGIDGGNGLFNVNTLSLLHTDSSYRIHYGDFLHYNGNLNARGSWAREVNFPNDNQLIYFENIATQYDGLLASIGSSTIYDKLANIALILAWRGLVSNTTNLYGVVNGSNQVTSWKSILPGPTSRDFTATAGGIILGDGIELDGTKALTHGTSLTWNFMSFSGGGYTDMDYTMYFKLNLGLVSNPDAAYGIMGNNGASASNKGVGLWYDDRASQSRNNALRFIISKGSAGLILDFINDNVITPNAYHVVCIEVDLSQATTNNKAKLWVDGVQISTTVTTFATAVSSGPTYNLQIGGTGNNVLPGILKVKDVVLQVQKDLDSVRTNFIQALMDAS